MGGERLRRWPAGSPRVLAVALAVLAVPALAADGRWAAATSTSTRMAHRSTPPDTPSPLPPATTADSPGATPSPTATATPPPTVARATPPPPRPATEPAHPPAAPPPALPPAPASVTVDVPVQRQVYSLSCEESALSMVLAFYGHTVSDQDVLTFVGVDQVHYWAGPGGGDPYVDFVGDPNGSEVRNTGYGVYWPPIQSAAAHFGAPVAQAGHGIASSAVYAAVNAGHPVIVWVTFDLKPHARSDYVAYDGRTVPYAGPEEHAMVVTGVGATTVRLNDPDRGQYWVSRDQFEAAFAVYDRMAVVFGGSSRATPTPTPTPTVSPTPTSTSTPTPAPTPSSSPSG